MTTEIYTNSLEQALTNLRAQLKQEVPNALYVSIKLLSVDMDLIETNGFNNSYLFEYKLHFRNETSEQKNL